MTTIEKIGTVLHIARKEIETLCNLASDAELTLFSVERHSLAAHHALNSYLNQVIAFFDPENKGRKTAFMAKLIEECEDGYLRKIQSEKYTKEQQMILNLAYEKSRQGEKHSLSYLREAGNEERHRLLMEKVLLSDKGYKVGSGNYVLACWAGSTCKVIESDFDFLPEEKRSEKPGRPHRNGLRRASGGSVLIFEKRKPYARCSIINNIGWSPGALMANFGNMNLFDSAIHSLGGGSLFLSSKSSIEMENCKIKMATGSFMGDLFLRDGRFGVNPYDSDSGKFINTIITEFTDGNVFVHFGEQKVNLIEYLLSAYCICEDIFELFKTLI